MLNPSERKRYHRHLILPGIGEEGQLKLKRARVLVVGAGGLGCPVLQYLCAAGVGHIGIIDPDYVSESNLHRQILFNSADTGKQKAAVAAFRLTAMNPFVSIEGMPVSLDVTNALDVIGAHDLVIDGSDNFATRYLVNDACVMLGKPFVSGAIYRYEAQVSVFNVGDGPTYRCLYPDPGDTPSCEAAGVLGVLPGVAGSLMANEAIKLITGTGELLSGKLLLIDLLTMRMDQFSFAAVEANKRITKLGQYDFACATGEEEITAFQLKDMQKTGRAFQLIDVREPDEFARGNIGGENIPLSQLATGMDRVAKDREVVLHCQSGIRSRKALDMLKAHGFSNVVHLKGGLSDF